MAKLTFKVQETLGVLSENMSGWSKELNLVSWNDRPAKFDIREWDENHEKMKKGITLDYEEMVFLKEALEKIDLDDYA